MLHFHDFIPHASFLIESPATVMEFTEFASIVGQLNGTASVEATLQAMV